MLAVQLLLILSNALPPCEAAQFRTAARCSTHRIQDNENEKIPIPVRNHRYLNALIVDELRCGWGQTFPGSSDHCAFGADADVDTRMHFDRGRVRRHHVAHSIWLVHAKQQSAWSRYDRLVPRKYRYFPSPGRSEQLLYSSQLQQRHRHFDLKQLVVNSDRPIAERRGLELLDANGGRVGIPRSVAGSNEHERSEHRRGHHRDQCRRFHHSVARH